MGRGAAGMWRWKPQPSMLYECRGRSIVEALLEGAQGEMILGPTAGFVASLRPSTTIVFDRNLGVIRRLMRDKDGAFGSEQVMDSCRSQGELTRTLNRWLDR